MHICILGVVRVNSIFSFQVLSTSVSNAFQFLKKEEFSETEKFCRMFDKFFDCLNTR